MEHFYPHKWAWIDGSGGTTGSRHRGCVHCGIPRPGKDTRYTALRTQECPVLIRQAIQGEDNLVIHPPTGPVEKIKAIRALRNVDPKGFGSSLKASKDFIEAAIGGTPQAFRGTRDPAMFIQDMHTYGFEVTAIQGTAESIEVSPQAMRVLEALRSKPELYAEVRAAILVDGSDNNDIR